jgi:prophage regulatory protein
MIRLPELKARTGLSASSVYRSIKRGDLPQPVQLGPNAVGWRLSEVLAWLAARPAVGKRGGCQ